MGSLRVQDVYTMNADRMRMPTLSQCELYQPQIVDWGDVEKAQRPPLVNGYVDEPHTPLRDWVHNKKYTLISAGICFFLLIIFIIFITFITRSGTD